MRFHKSGSSPLYPSSGLASCQTMRPWQGYCCLLGWLHFLSATCGTKRLRGLLFPEFGSLPWIIQLSLSRFLSLLGSYFHASCLQGNCFWNHDACLKTRSVTRYTLLDLCVLPVTLLWTAWAVINSRTPTSRKDPTLVVWTPRAVRCTYRVTTILSWKPPIAVAVARTSS